jgi:hypothetical protein
MLTYIFHEIDALKKSENEHLAIKKHHPSTKKSHSANSEKISKKDQIKVRFQEI